MKNFKKLTALILVSVMLLMFCGCGKTSITGSWLSSGDSQAAYTLNSDGTGVYKEGDISLSITYTTQGDQLSIDMTYLGQSKSQTYTYGIKGSTLTLTSSNGDVTTFSKQ